MKSNVVNESILLFGFMDPFFLDVTKYLSSLYCELILVTHDSRKSMIPVLSNLQYLRYEYLFQGDTVSFAFAPSDKAILDAWEYAQFSECKSYFFRLLDRVFLSPLSSHCQEYYFRELLCYWIGYLRNRPNIKKIIFHATPHFPADIVLFYAAHFLNRNTTIIRRTAIDDSIVLATDFRAGKSKLIYIPDSKLKDRKDSFICSSKNESFALKYSKFIIGVYDSSFDLKSSKSQKNQPLRRKFILVALKIKTVITTWLSTIITTWLSNEWYCFKMKRKDMFSFRVKRTIQRFKAVQWLNRNTVMPDFSENYIYFPLHFRPERSTEPEANEFFDQLSCLALISAAIPDDWKIYVKEHPRQIDDVLNPDLRRTHFPEILLYRQIVKIPKTIFISTSVSSDKLIEKCRLTASCTGSTVWEGLNKGKPGITFGDTWHSACASSPVVQTHEDIKSATLGLSEKTPRQVAQDLEEFVEHIYGYVIQSAYSYSSAISSKHSYTILVRNLALSIKESLNYCE